jgi:hypothetical protein
MNIPYKKYMEQKHRARGRSIDFLLTFEEWWDLWDQSGNWELRGRGTGKYVMARFGDKGPYAIGNVHIVPHIDNVREMHAARVYTAEYRKNISDGLKGKVKTVEHKQKLSDANKGKTKVFSDQHKENLKGPKKTIACPHCNTIGAVHLMHRWHMDNCKAINIK